MGAWAVWNRTFILVIKREGSIPIHGRRGEEKRGWTKSG